MYSQIDSNKRKSWLLVSLFIGLLAGVGYVYGFILSENGWSAIIVALLVALGMTAVSWFAGDTIALASTHAVALKDRAQFPSLWNAVENLAITAGIPMPTVYVIEDASPNAFATGRDPKHASVVVTTGLLQILNQTELEGVLSHELSHIKNLDTRLLMLVLVLVGAISLIGNGVFRFGGMGRRRDRREGDASGILMIVGIVFIILSPIIAQLIRLAISRKREFLADASGALLTRYPEGLASALEKIKTANIPMTTASPATNPLWIAEPTASSLSQRVSTLFSTHPPIEERIARLRNSLDRV